MGRKKIDTSTYQENDLSRDILYSKRKRNLLKHCMQLSQMCGQDISLTIFDSAKQKLVQYCSTYDFNPKTIAQLIEPRQLCQLSYQIYCNDQYEKVTEIRRGKDKDSITNNDSILETNNDKTSKKININESKSQKSDESEQI